VLIAIGSAADRSLIGADRDQRDQPPADPIPGS
jgi:hypothetical protein